MTSLANIADNAIKRSGERHALMARAYGALLSAKAELEVHGIDVPIEIHQAIEKIEGWQQTRDPSPSLRSSDETDMVRG